MPALAGLRKSEVELKDVHSTFKDRPLIFWSIVFSIVLTNFVVSYFINLYYFASPLVVSGIHADPIYIGISTSVFTFGVITFSALGGSLFHRLSIRNLIVMAIAISTVFSLLTGLAGNLPELLAFRFLVGLGNGIIQAVITAVLGGMYQKRRGFLLSLKGVTYSSGVLAGPYTESLFAPLYTPAFEYSALAGVASLILLLLFLPDLKMRMSESRIPHLRKLFNWNTTLTFLAMFFFGIGFFGFISYYSHFLLYYLDLSTLHSAMIVSSVGVGGIILTIPLAASSDRWGRKPVIMVIFAICSMTTFSIFYYSVPFITLMAISFIFGGAYNGLVNLIAAAAQDWAHDDAIGTASGTIFSFYYAGGIIGGSLFGYVHSVIGFPDAGIIAVTSFMVIAFFCSLLLKGTAKRPAVQTA